MDEDDDYFTPSASSSRRLAMLFSPEDVTSSRSSSSSTGCHSDPSTRFRFVAPKQPQPGRSNSTLSGSGQASSGDSQEVHLEVPLTLLPQGTERNGMPRTPIICQVVGSVAERCFSLVVVAVAAQTTEEPWKAAIDSHLILEVVEHSILKMTVQTGKTLTLLGETERIEALVMQLAIFRGVASDRVTQQDLCAGKGHILSEGDVAKVSCTTYAITSNARRGEKVEDVRGVRVTVGAPGSGGWESWLAGASADTHRLIFIPEHKEGQWLPPTTYHDVMVAKVRSRGGAGAKEKVAAAAGTAAVALANGQNGDRSECQSSDTPEEEDRASKKAALISRMAQVGTPLFPLLPCTRAMPCPQPSVPQAVEESQGAPVEEMPAHASTTASARYAHAHTLAPVSTQAFNSATVSTSDPPCGPVLALTATITATTTPTTTPNTTTTTPTTTTTSTTTTTPTPGPVLVPTSAAGFSFPAPHLQALDTTLALSICQLGTTVTKLSERVDFLLGKVEKVEERHEVEAGGGSLSAPHPTSDPEALMALASGLVAHNERLRAQLEVTERRLAESQAAHTLLLTMNTQLLEEKREMLRRDDEDKKEKLRKEESKENEKQKDQREMEASQQREMEAGQQREMEAGQQREMEASQQREMEASQQREMEASQQREMEAGQQREMEAGQQREMEAGQQREMEAGQQREMEAGQQREMEAGQQRETEQGNGQQHGLPPEQVRSLFKATLSGLFRHLSSNFNEEETQFTRPHVLHTLRSGLEMAFSSLVGSLEEMAEEEEKEEEEEVVVVVVGGGGGRGRQQENEDEEEEQEEEDYSGGQE